jgi:DNA polymerase-3 subunit delta
VAALTLVLGDEDLLVGRAVNRALAATPTAPDSGDEPFVVEYLDGSIASPDDVAAAFSPSLFATERGVVLTNLQDADKAVVAALVAFAENPEPDVAVVATHAGGVKGKAAIEAIKATGARVIEVTRIKTVRDREQFAIDEVSDAGATLARDAAADLVAAIGSDLRELATACFQLAADVGGRIDADDVAAYYRGRAESSGFAIADRAVEGDLAAALETLRWAFATGLDPILVSGSLAANLRAIAAVGSAGPGSPDAVATKTGMPAWKVRRVQGWLRRWHPDALGDAVRAVAVADADLKGAGDDPAYAVERAVMIVAAAANAGS